MNEYLVTFAEIKPRDPKSSLSPCTMVFRAASAEDALVFARVNFIEKTMAMKDGQPIPVFTIGSIQAHPLK